ncbi:hypothetical protein TWF730_000106 [Orbilia blumenaviensis]|uniref:Uncharacterized protein n=1 Tax=Orbilia blumenaviensis TaxID=1796055 RepID=A0AAV9VNS1_9PEZI
MIPIGNLISAFNSSLPYTPSTHFQSMPTSIPPHNHLYSPSRHYETLPSALWATPYQHRSAKIKMSQSAPSSPTLSLKPRIIPIIPSRVAPHPPPKRQTSVVLDTPSSLTSLSESEAPRKEYQITSIVACIPDNFNSFWDIVADGLSWHPTERTMPPQIQTKYLNLIQINRQLQERIRTDKWVRDLLEEHFVDISEHCDEITSGKVAKPMGNEFVLSLVDPSHFAFRRFWVDCVIGNQQRHKLARRSVGEFMNIAAPRVTAPTNPSTAAAISNRLPVYTMVCENVSGKLDELARLGRFMAGMVNELETVPLQFGMRYQPLTRREREIVDEVIWWAENIANFYPLDPEPRERAKNYVQLARSLFSGDRLIPLEVRFKDWNVSEDGQNGQIIRPPLLSGGTAPSPLETTDEQRKVLMIRHIYLIERHVNALWRELFLNIKQCLDIQLACHEWYNVMQERYHATVQKIRDTRRRPDMRLYIGLKEQRAGKKLNRWG